MNPGRAFLATVGCLLITSTCLLIGASPGFCEPGWLKEVAREAEHTIASDEATAILLHHTAKVEVSSSGRATTEVRSAYKILTKGGEDFATLSHPVYPFLKVGGLKCWVVTPKGKVRSLEKDEIVTMGLMGSAGYYDDSQVLIARPSHVEPGDIVAFQMKIKEEGWTSYHQSFTFQVQQPVKFARFSLKVPSDWQVIYGTWRAEDVDFEQQDNQYTWTAHDLEHQPDEPLSPSWHYLSRRLSVSCHDPEKQNDIQFPDWSSVAKWCADVYREPSTATVDVTQISEETAGGFAAFEGKARAIAEFTQDDIRYVAIEIGKHRWEPRPASTTLFNRYGDCKDKSVLMVGMLEAAGIDAVPVLCNVRYPVDPRVPSPFQFNHCIVAIPMEGDDPPPALEDAVVGGWLFFDPTDPTTRIGQIPWNLQGNRVLVATDADSVLLKLPYPEPEGLRRVYAAAAQLGDDGSFSARVTVTDFGGAAARSRYVRKITAEKEQIEGWVGMLSKAVPSVEISDYRAGEAEDSVRVSFSMVGGHYVQDAGGLSLFRPDVFHAPEPPVLTAKERRFPVWFGPPKEIRTEVDWELPEGWIAEVDTTAAEYACEGASISSKMTLSGGGFRAISIYRQSGRLVWPDDYDSAREFSRNLTQVRGQVVMVKRP